MLRSISRLATSITARPLITATPSLASKTSLFRPTLTLPSTDQLSRNVVIAVRDDEDLRKEIEKAGPEKLIIVDWTAKWCGPCQTMAPIYETLSNDNKNAVFIKADIDILQDASVEAGVQSVPTFHFIKNNELVAEFSGADANKLRTLLKQHA